MSKRHQSIVDRLAGWWRGAPDVRASVSDTNTRKQKYTEACLEDPQAARSAFQEEQRLIAQELEETFLAYDRKLRTMAERLAGHTQATRAGRGNRNTPTVRELSQLRQEQLDLWRLIRRAQAAARSTRALERELQEWSSREATAVASGHPDHPQTRAEIVTSELRIRGASDARAHQTSAPVRLEVMPTEDDTVEDATVSVQTAPVEDEGPAWVHETDEHMLREIASREREMDRLLHVSEDPMAAAELAAFARELRTLHAHLRQHDRRMRIQRVRWTMGVPMGH